MLKTVRIFGATWGILGITLIIGSAVMRLLPHIRDAFNTRLSALEWAVLIVWVLSMLIGEGYRGFQKQFSPRVASRMWHLANHGQTIDLWLAPLYCMGYFHASRRRMISSWSLTLGVTAIIIVVIHFSQPWRGIIDCGVVLGLLYGLLWVYICSIQVINKHGYIADPELDAKSGTA